MPPVAKRSSVDDAEQNPNKKPAKKKNLQETAQIDDDGRSHTETIEKWFKKTKEKGEGKKGKRTRANVLEPE